MQDVSQLVATKTATITAGSVERTNWWFGTQEKHVSSIKIVWARVNIALKFQRASFAKVNWTSHDPDVTTAYLVQMLSVKHQTSKMVRTSLVTWRFNVTLLALLAVWSPRHLHNGGGTGIGKAIN